MYHKCIFGILHKIKKELQDASTGIDVFKLMYIWIFPQFDVKVIVVNLTLPGEIREKATTIKFFEIVLFIATDEGNI
jgi:hypothetical protein